MNDGASLPEHGSRHRRRSWLVRARFQLKSAVFLGSAVFGFTALVGTVLYGELGQLARQQLVYPGTNGGPAAYSILIFGGVLAAVTSAALGCWFVVTTHRICGPLVRLQKYMDELAQGELPEVYPPRKNDELNDLFTAFSNVVEFVRSRHLSQRMCESHEGAADETACHDEDSAQWNVELGTGSAAPTCDRVASHV